MSEWFAACSGPSLQHSQSASPADVRIYNENLGMSVNHAARADQARHPHVTRAPEPPPVLHDGALPGRGRAPAVENHGIAAASANQQRVAGSSSMRAGVEDADQRLPVSPDTSTQFTSDISLASSSVTAYEDNGRQKVCLSAYLFDIVASIRVLLFLPFCAFSVICACSFSATDTVGWAAGRSSGL